MTILDKAERKFGRYAIKDLMLYIVGLNGLVYLLSYLYPESGALAKLVLDPDLVRQGEFWRLFSFVVIPPASSILWIFFILSLYYTVGLGLEHEWGSFRFNLYYLTGIAGTAAAAFISGLGSTALYLNLSLFLAFAYIYPDYQILLFFVLPVKVKYLAWLNWAFIAFTVLTASMPAKLAAIASVSNYFLFFGREIIATAGRARTGYSWRQKINRQPARTSIHRCATCGKTEKDDPEMYFRYCSTCKGDYEYCMDHLKTHEHVKS